MAAKKKAKKTRASKARKPKVGLNKSAKKKAASRNKKVLASKKKTAPRKKKAARRKPSKRAAVTRSRRPPKGTVQAKTRTRGSAFSRGSNARARSADADSQGLSNIESADSESVGELLDEGNTFEAGVVAGVERADDSDEQEVRTREVPEDDVPEEYLDQD
jgi:hypothetical protein